VRRAVLRRAVVRRAAGRRADVPDLRAVVRRAPPDRAVVLRPDVPPDFLAVVLRPDVDRRAVVDRADVVLRRAVEPLRAVEPDALRADRAPARPPPGSAFSAFCSASLATLRAVFSQEALPLRRFAGSFLICFSMLSSALP
jgi:hypothetical protein